MPLKDGTPAGGYVVLTSTIVPTGEMPRDKDFNTDCMGNRAVFDAIRI